jgi:hypothetical protein
VTFTDLSTNTPASWAWTFPGGTPASSTLQNPVVVYNTAGTYSVTLVATNAGGSSAPFTMTNYITVKPIPAAPVATNTGPFCAGTTINLFSSAVGGATYSWTGPSAFASALQNPTRPGATAAMAGTYSVTATVLGCTSVFGTTTVVVNPTPTVTVPANITACAGQNIPASAFVSSPAGGTFAWTNSNTSIGLAASGSGNVPSFTATNPGGSTITGAIVVTATVAGCNSAPTTYTITVNPLPATPVATNTGPYCAGTTINIATPTVTGATYAWTGPSAFSSALQNPTRPSATAAMAGTYSVTITVGGCASLFGTTTVVVNPIPATPVATNTGPFCSGTTINLFSSAIGGATYSWTGPSAFSSILQNPTRPGATAAMAGTYSVTATAAGCASAFGTTTVVVNSLPTVTVNSPTICPGGTATLTASGGTTYLWSTGSTANPLSVSPAVTTTYTVTGTSSGCSASAVATVTMGSSLTVSVNSPTICAGAPAVLTATGATTYLWNTGSTVNPLTVTLATTTTYTVTGTSAGCTGSAVATVTVNPLPVTTVNSPTICAGATATLTAGGATTYTWTAGATPTGVSTASASPVTTTTFTVTGTSLGCTSTAVSTVTVNPLPIVTVNSATICTGQTATLLANGGATYLWNTGSTSNPLVVTPGTTTSYTVTGTSLGCTASAVGTVTVNSVPATPTISQSGSVLTSSSATGNQWYLNGTLIAGATSQNYTFTANGTYTVVVTTGGCSSAASSGTVITTTGIDEATNPYLFNIYPNPNDGNFNITFNSAIRSNYKLELYNALGQIIFRDEIVDFTGVYTKKLSVAEYGKGVYTISLTNSKNETVKKIIVY